MRAVIVCTIAVMLMSTAAHAQRVCGKHGDIVARLDRGYQERRTHLGVSSDGRLIELLSPVDPDAHVPPHGLGLVFVVEDVNAWHDRLQRFAVKITMGLEDRPWGHRSFGLEDPDGVPVTIAEIVH